METPFRYLRTGLFSVLGLFIFIGICASWYLHSDLFRKQILNVLNHHIPGSISIQNINVFLLPGRIEIEGLRFLDFFQQTAIACDHLSIELSWQPLLMGEFVIQTAIIKHPSINVSVYPDGTLNLSHIFSTPISDSENLDSAPILFPPLNVKKLTIDGATVEYADTQKNLSVCIANMDISLSADFTKQTGHADIQIAGSQISGNDIHTTTGPVTIQTGIDDGQFIPLHLTVASPALNAEVSGNISKIQQYPELTLNLNLKLNTALTDLQQSLNLPLPLSGRVQIDGDISGPLFNPNAELRLTSEHAVISDYSLPNLLMTTRLQDRILSWDSLSKTTGKGAVRITGSADLKQAFASGDFRGPVELSALSGSMQIILENMNLDAIHPDAAGTINGTLSVQCNGYPEHDLKGNIGADVQGRRISLNPDIDPMDVQIHSQSQWAGGSLQVQHLQAQAGSTRLTASGTWNAENHHITGQVTCQSDNLAKSLSPLGVRGVSGSIDLQSRLSGTLERPVFTLKLKSSKLGVGDVQIGSLAVDAALDPSGLLRIDSLSLKNKNSELTANGEIPLYRDGASNSAHPISFISAFRRMQPIDFFPSSGIQGAIDGNCRLEGSIAKLSGSMQLQATGMKIAMVRLGNIRGDFRLTDGRIQSQRLVLETPGSHADFSGMIQLLEPSSLSLHPTMPYRLSSSNMTLASEEIVDFLKGKIIASAEMEGTRSQIRSSTTLRSGQLEIGPHTARQKLTGMEVSADYKDGRLHVSKAGFALAPDEWLYASGWLSTDSSFQVDIAANNISLSHIDTVADYRQDISGKMFLQLSGNGKLNHPRFQGEVVLKPFRFYENEWDETRVALKVADDVARFDLHSPIRGILSCGLYNQNYAADLGISHLDLTPFFKIGGIENIGGTLSGKIAAAGRFDSWKSFKADVGISDLSLYKDGRPLVSGRELNISIQNEAMIISPNRLFLFKDGILDIGGESRLGQDVSLRLDAEIPVQAAGYFYEGLSGLRGSLNISAAIKGPWHKPAAEALLELKHGGFTIETSGQDIHDVNGRIRVAPTTIAIDYLEAQLNGGRISVEGKAAIDAYKMQSIDIRMAASQVPINIEDTLDAKLNADLTLNGTVHSSALQGEIVVLEGLYYRNVNLNPIRSMTQRTRGYHPRSEITFPPAIQNTQLDIRIPPRNFFVVDNNMAQLKLSPDMRITGTLQHPVIQGRTSIDSGSLQYHSTMFTVKKGFVDFINPYTLESVLDIQGQAFIQNWTVFLDISGPLDKLNLKLSSTPFLDDNDLLSLLFTGKTRQTAISNTTDSSSSSQKMLADLLSAAVGSEIKKTSGLDILEVDSTSKSRGSNEDPLKVTFGKIISPRVTLKYSVESKSGVTFQRTITEYILFENILLSGFQDSRGVFGGEIKYRHEFR
jgi:autotransporter translocation and assembly factor TamB